MAIELDDFLAGIIEEPDNRRRRRMFADWLREEGSSTVGHPEWGELMYFQLENIGDKKLGELDADTLRQEQRLWDALPRRIDFFEGCTGPYRTIATIRQRDSPESQRWRDVLGRTAIVGIVHLGFLDEVRADLEWWQGRHCDECLMLHGETVDDTARCPRCGNRIASIGTIDRNGPQVVGRQPVRRVTLTDRRPLFTPSHRAATSLATWTIEQERGGPRTHSNQLPSGLFAELDGWCEESGDEKRFDSMEAALVSASRALLKTAVAEWKRIQAVMADLPF